jgi:catechol 2,3-dioxygenase-like lactoylglutathione lyase family enzyme
MANTPPSASLGLAAAELVAFVPSSDLTRARSFYADVLGLRFLEETAFACVFDANGTTLRVTLVEALQPVGYTALGWQVDDLAACAAALSARGVEFVRYEGMAQDERGAWTTPAGDRVAWFRDPDGNTLSVTQLSRRT